MSLDFCVNIINASRIIPIRLTLKLPEHTYHF